LNFCRAAVVTAATLLNFRSNQVSYDLESFVTGKALYGMDARVEGMVYASIERPPVIGGKVKAYDDKDALKVAGVRQIVPIDPFKPPPTFQPLGGIAVIADNTWAAFQGRKKLNISWENGPNETYDSEEYKNELRETSHRPCKVVRNVGDALATFAKGGKVYEADYYVPLLAHASMEPMVALAEFKDGKVTAWAPTQNPQAAQDIISQELGIAKEMRHLPRPGWRRFCGWKNHEGSGPSVSCGTETDRCGTRSDNFRR
jgi:isoquinoline 1-oxidoreductase subunit beta